MTDCVWRAVPVEQLLTQEWDRESVVFDSLTGDTHLLDVVGTSVLRGLRAGILSPAGLADFVASDLELAPDQELLPAIERVLSTFDRLGLAGQHSVGPV